MTNACGSKTDMEPEHITRDDSPHAGRIVGFFGVEPVFSGRSPERMMLDDERRRHFGGPSG